MDDLLTSFVFNTLQKVFKTCDWLSFLLCLTPTPPPGCPFVRMPSNPASSPGPLVWTPPYPTRTPSTRLPFAEEPFHPRCDSDSSSHHTYLMDNSSPKTLSHARNPSYVMPSSPYVGLAIPVWCTVAHPSPTSAYAPPSLTAWGLGRSGR